MLVVCNNKLTSSNSTDCVINSSAGLKYVCSIATI